jgi:hypothetical protein
MCAISSPSINIVIKAGSITFYKNKRFLEIAKWMRKNWITFKNKI